MDGRWFMAQSLSTIAIIRYRHHLGFSPFPPRSVYSYIYSNKKNLRWRRAKKINGSPKGHLPLHGDEERTRPRACDYSTQRAGTGDSGGGGWENHAIVRFYHPPNCHAANIGELGGGGGGLDGTQRQGSRRPKKRSVMAGSLWMDGWMDGVRTCIIPTFLHPRGGYVS